MGAFPELQQPLSDGHVLLRYGTERDIPEILIAHQDDPGLSGRLGQPRPPSGAELGQAADRAREERAAGVRAELTILAPGSDDCRGRVVVRDVDWETGEAELDVWVAPEARGRGCARRALSLTTAWLSQACGLERLRVGAYVDEEA